MRADIPANITHFFITKLLWHTSLFNLLLRNPSFIILYFCKKKRFHTFCQNSSFRWIVSKQHEIFKDAHDRFMLAAVLNYFLGFLYYYFFISNRNRKKKKNPIWNKWKTWNIKDMCVAIKYQDIFIGPKFKNVFKI